MAEFDMLEYQKELKSSRLKRLLKNKKALIALGVMGANIPGVFINEFDYLQALSAFVIGFEIELLKREYQKLSYSEESMLILRLKETETFKLCCEEYDKYITSVASLIRDLKFPSSKDTLAYLQLLLSSGHFSKYHRHQYKLYPYEKVELLEICGARVLTGKSVCRHQSSFLVDVLNKLGYTAANMSVIATASDPIRLAKQKYKKWNHAVVSVSENNQMYLFDPTCGHFCARPTDISFEEIESVLVGQFVIPEKKFLVMNPHSNQINTNHELEFQKIITSKPMVITSGEVEYLNNKAELVYRGNMHNQYQFFMEQESQREEIEKMYQELCPYSDKPIKKWLVRS